MCFYRYTKMKTATNIYIFNLALADALATSTLPFQSTKYLMRTWPFGRLLCKVIISIDYYNMFTSIFTLTMMSVDRYIAVCHPVRALEFRTAVKAKMINVCIWILASAVGIPIMVMAVTKEVDSGKYLWKIEIVTKLAKCTKGYGYFLKLGHFVLYYYQKGTQQWIIKSDIQTRYENEYAT